MYTEEFKQKVLSLYGDDEYIKKMLDTDDPMLGRIIEETPSNISAETIVESYENGNLQYIYQQAKKTLALQELYREWYDLYVSYMHSQGVMGWPTKK